LSQKEASRYDIIRKTIKKEIKGIEAAEILKPDRQAYPPIKKES